MKRFIIKLHEPHKKTGLSAYIVAKKLGLHEGTVRKFVSDEVVAEFLPAHVLQLVEFYGLDWQDPKVIEVVEMPDEEESSGQMETALTPA